MNHPVRRSGPRLALSPLVLCAAVCAPPSFAQELEYGIGAGVGWTDNISRAPTGGEDEGIATIGLDLRWQREGRLSGDVLIGASYMDYLDDTYSSDVVGGVNAELRFGIVPGRLDWLLWDTFGQMDLDPFEASTPDTRENVNYLTTGPLFTMRLGSAARLQLAGTYSNTMYEETNLDNERLMGSISVFRETASRGEVSLNLVAESIDFDDSMANTDYDRQSLYVGYEIEGARTRLSASAGYTGLDGFGDTRYSPLFGIQLERELTPTSTLTFDAGVRSSDASDAFRNGDPTGGGGSRPGEVATSDPFEMRYTTVGWTKSGQRTTLGLSAGWEEDIYETNSALNRERLNFQATLQRRLTTNLRAQLTGTVFSNDYGELGYDDTEWRAGLRLSWNLSGRLYLEMDADHYDRSSSNPSTEYDENRVFFRLVWRNRAEQ